MNLISRNVIIHPVSKINNIERFGYHQDGSFESLGTAALKLRLSADKPITKAVPPEIELQISRGILTPTDTEYIRAILQRTPEVASSAGYLLQGIETPAARRKIAERNSQAHIDLGQLLSPFSEKEKAILTQNLGEFQLTDGCTVGCAWCGVNALRRTTTAFSLQSVVKFAHEYGNLSKNAGLYSASDPFDWVEGDYTYLDIHAVWGIYSKSEPFVSTAVPLGTEFSILRFVEAQYEALRKSSILDGSNFRFSRTDRNAERVDQMLNILRLRGLNEDFLNTIRISDVSDKKVAHIGYFINHRDRDDIYDNPGITCKDCIVITPSAIRGKTMEAYTKTSPKGMREWTIAPGEMQVPVYRIRQDYYGSDFAENQDVGTVPFSILPDVKILHVKDGEVVDEEVVRSIGRTALAFCFTAWNMHDLGAKLTSDQVDYFLNNFPGGLRSIEKHLIDFERRYLTMKDESTPLLDDPNQIAIKIAREYESMTRGELRNAKKAVETLKKRRRTFLGLQTPIPYY